jgi:hypothetical protein
VEKGVIHRKILSTGKSLVGITQKAFTQRSRFELWYFAIEAAMGRFSNGEPSHERSYLSGRRQIFLGL